jgi:hypothetical protein
MAKKVGKPVNGDLTGNDTDALRNDLKMFGYLLPETEEEEEEFEKIYGKTQVMFPEHLKSLDFSKKTPLNNQSSVMAGATNKAIPSPKNSTKGEKKVEKLGTARKSTKKDYFKKLVLCAEIVDQLHGEPTFGHVKFVKLQYLSNQVCEMNLSGNYQKFAAGPLDAKWIHQVDAQFKRLKWFNVAKTKYGAYKYSRGANVAEYKKYFAGYFRQQLSSIQNFIDLLRDKSSDFCEIVATIYFLMKEFKQQRKLINNGSLLEGFYSWHDQKKRFKQADIENVISWMYQHNIVPNN